MSDITALTKSCKPIGLHTSSPWIRVTHPYQIYEVFIGNTADLASINIHLNTTVPEQPSYLILCVDHQIIFEVESTDKSITMDFSMLMQSHYFPATLIKYQAVYAFIISPTEPLSIDVTIPSQQHKKSLSDYGLGIPIIAVVGGLRDSVSRIEAPRSVAIPPGYNNYLSVMNGMVALMHV